MAEEKIGNLLAAIIALIVFAWKVLVALFLVGIMAVGAVMVVRDALHGDAHVYPFLGGVVVLAAIIWLLNRPYK
jgi:hypothetical protein